MSTNSKIVAFSEYMNFNGQNDSHQSPRFKLACKQHDNNMDNGKLLCTVVERAIQGHCNRKWLSWLYLRKFALNSEILLKTNSNSPSMAQDNFQIDF